MCIDIEKIKKANIMMNSLCIFTNLKNDIVLKKYKKLLSGLSENDINIEEIVNLYNEFVYELLDKGKEICLKKYIIDKIFLDNNAFTSMIDSKNINNENILKQVKYELEVLQYISSIESRKIKECILNDRKIEYFEAEVVKSLLNWDININKEYDTYKAIDKLKLNILNSDNWGDSLENIIEFYKKYGTGIFGEYRAFVWENENGKEYLRGIKSPDPVTLKDLVGYEEQKKTIIENTEQFLKGFKANNLLLYGQRGTGKSSTVKAILNEYYTEGLRLIEVDKDKLADFTKIIRILQNKNLKFIIFVDDLVFQDGEASYSALKTILEGGLESNVNNILIYATTNRKHLVKETFSERETDDVRANDSIEEKLSLSDRFGITVSFYSPDQRDYLKIIDGIADARELEVDREYLHAEAIKWTRWYNARSPRTAKQFINWFEANLKK